MCSVCFCLRFALPLQGIMKKYVFCLLVLAMSLITTTAFGEQSSEGAVRGGMRDSVREDGRALDSIEVSLLTCAPGTRIYNLFGHTAIRCHNITKKRDYVFNYGLFSFRQKGFLWLFATGQTDYELGVEKHDAFMCEYLKRGRDVTEQMLLLTPQEKVRLEEALYLNAMPENRVYRYNYFYRNCTTEARDVILYNALTQNSVQMEMAARHEPMSYRDVIHKCAAGHPWSELAMTLCLGHGADVQRTTEELEFLPENLMSDCNAIRCVRMGDDRGEMPLVGEQQTYKAAPIVCDTDVWDVMTPLRCMAVLAVVLICFFFVEIRRKKIYWGLDVVLLTLIGLSGVVLTVVRFSEHPCVSLNANWYLFSPIAFVILFFDISACLHHRHTRWWLWYELLFVYLLIVDVTGFQDVPLFSEIMASFLLLRSMTRRMVEHRRL